MSSDIWAVASEHDRMDEVLGEPDRQERDRDQHDAEQGVDRRDAGPAGTVGQRKRSMK